MAIQKHWNLFTFIVLTLGLVWIGLTAWLSPSTLVRSQSIPHTGFLAPDFMLESNTGKSIRLSELRGHVIVINIWASWCSPCQIEMPALQAAYEQYQSQGLIILGVNSTFQDDLQNAIAFVNSSGLSFPILFDLTGSVTQLYQVHGFPTTYFIDFDGIVREVVIGGPLNQSFLLSKIDALLYEVR